jgi:uncharacterized protein (DUF488 family)
VPRSRRHPHFTGDALSQSLPARGIDYRHERALGGFRRPQPDSPNAGWQEPMFQGYADHMTTREFVAGLDRLQQCAREEPSCIMCAEAQWWRCHRRLVADAFLVRGWRVLHLGLRRDPVEHTLTPFAVAGPGRTVTYPQPAG